MVDGVKCSRIINKQNPNIRIILQHSGNNLSTAPLLLRLGVFLTYLEALQQTNKVNMCMSSKAFIQRTPD